MTNRRGFLSRGYAAIDTIAAFGLLAVFALVVIQVFWRYVLNDPLVWPEEVARTTYLWVGYLGLVGVVRNGSGYRIDYFVNKLPQRLRDLAALASDVVALVFFVVLIAYSWQVIAKNWNVTTSISTPVNLIYLSLPVAALFIVPALAVGIWRKAERLTRMTGR